MLDRDLSSIVRESCSKARGEQKGGGGEWRRASEATGPDIGPVLSLSPPSPPPTRLSGVFPPFCSSLHGVAFSRWASNRNRDPPKPPRLLLARLLAPPLALIRSSLFLILPPHFILNSPRSCCALFRFLPPRLLRVVYTIDENCPRKDAISSQDRDERGLSRGLSLGENRDFRSIFSFHRVID